MPSKKPRVATYTTQDNIDKLRVIAACHGLSMSEYLTEIIEKDILIYELKNGIINIK